MINDGKIAAQIGKTLNLSKPHVSYYIHKSKDLGYVNESIRDAITVLELTQAGKNFLDRYEKDHCRTPVCRAENIRFKAEILKMPTIPVDWKRVQMKNWVQYSSRVDTVMVRLNMGNSPTIELIPSPVDGEDPYDLFIILLYDCINVIFTLHDRIGIKVGRLQLGSRGEWSVYDPIARAFCKSVGQVSYEGVAKVNASKPGHFGEFEFHDPRALLDYLAMPERVHNIEQHSEKIEQLLRKLLKTDKSAVPNHGVT